jgi:FG-GAP-like repeat
VTIFPGLRNTLSVQVRGKAGGVLSIEIIGVDNDPPTISATVSLSPNAAGWNNSPVTVTFTCSDKTSGVASCPSPVTVSTEGANQVVSGTATDLAGNTATASVTINLDMTPPAITGTINPPPDAGGYNSSAVTVTFNCSDALSGVASCSSPVAVTTEGTTQVPGMASDVAGNTASITINVNISFNYFKIQSWQTGPNGNAKSPSGKCLDYGPPQPGTGATVFLNDCSSAHPIRVAEIGDQTDVQGFVRHHDVVLFAGVLVIGIHNPPANTLGGPPRAPSAQSEYPLELQTYNPILATTLNQIFALDGDSIILESSRPCINRLASTSLCPPPPPQLVIQIQNARGANGSPLVAAVRNLSDNEFWDFVPQPGSRPYPTTGFISLVAPPGAPASSATPITTNWQLWNAICGTPQVQARTDYALIYNPAQPFNSILNNFGGCSYIMPDGTPIGWGTVLVVAGDDLFECQTYAAAGPCIDLSGYPAIQIPAGVTIRGNRRGTNFGPQLFASYISASPQFCHYYCMLQVTGDYVRITGLRARGQSRSTDKLDLRTNGIEVDYAADMVPSPPALPQLPYPLFTITQLIATIDHNDMSDWEDGAIDINSPFYNDSSVSGNCSYADYRDATGIPLDYTCDQFFPLAPNVPFPPSFGLSAIPIAEDPINPPGPGTLANVRVNHNFLHHNMRNEGGYGVGVQGRAFIDANTFSWNRHDITANGDPHYEYRASHNLVLSGAPNYGLIIGRLQDFDQHGTYAANDAGLALAGLFIGGAGGYYVEIDGNTFLGRDGHDYLLRGFPIVNSYYHDNVSGRSESDAIHFQICLTCVYDYTAQGSTTGSQSLFPITILNSQFGQATPDPTSTLGVGDFDGDGDDDLFLATGVGWYYSPAGKREWRYLNSAHDTVDQLLFGDFDGDGRTDVVGMRNGKLYVSWGGISAFDLLNEGVPANCTMADMAVGDFDGDGYPDIFCADYRNNTWWVSFGGNTAFKQVATSSFPRQALLFGDFDGNGTTDVFAIENGKWAVSYSPKGMPGSPFSMWQALPVSLTNTVNGLVVADFDGNGIADVGMPCGAGGVLGIGASPGWQISYGGAQGWSTCNAFAGSLNSANCSLIFSGLLSLSPCITLTNGAVGHFSGGPGADILLWSYYNTQLAATLWDFPGGTGAPYQLSSQDMH